MGVATVATATATDAGYDKTSVNFNFSILCRQMDASVFIKLHMFLALMIYAARSPTVDPQHGNITSCSQHCRCYTDSEHRIYGKCAISGLSSSQLAEICLPRDLFSL